MRRVIVLISIAAGLFASGTGAKEPDLSDHRLPAPRILYQGYLDSPRDSGSSAPARAPAAVADTFILGTYTFNGPGGPDPQGWTGLEYSEDLVTALFFHVADSTELNGGSYGDLNVLKGDRSLWCGAMPDSSGDLCGYQLLPGYGNSWQQYFTSIAFPRTGDVEISFMAYYDSEPGEDFTYLQYWHAMGYWETLDDYDWIRSGSPVKRHSYTIPDSVLPDSVRVRFYFRSDGAWSDEDGLWDTDGAIVIDSLVVSDGGGIIDFQDFEEESPGAHATADGHWVTSTPETRGNFSGLFPGTAVLQEDGCTSDLTALWGFFNGSTDDYSCGGHPGQAVVPLGVPGSYNRLDFVSNEIRSPYLDWNHDMNGGPIPASAEQALLEFDVYRDLGVNSLVFYRWHVRSFKNGCAGEWVDDRYVYYGDRKDWFRHRVQIGQYVDPQADSIQVALGVADMCAYWCGYYGDGSCHSHAPLFDNVRIVRVNTAGPAWDVPENRYVYRFQDNFAADGSITGTVPIDGPRNLSSGNVTDEARLYVTSPAGIDRHFPGDILTGPAVYCHVKDVSPEKSGEVISGDPARYHWISTAGGWTTLQCYGTNQGQSGPDFIIDLNDNLFEPGDTIWYYFSARDVNGITTYWSDANGATTDEEEARANPMEVTCLPANAVNGATDILYVDGFDGFGAQPCFEAAFDMLGITPDRFDMTDPAFNTLSGPGGRVIDVPAQIGSVYRTIIWNTGYLRYAGIHDGIPTSPNTLSSDDFGLLYEFLDGNPDRPGVYLSGDNLASWWLTRTGAGAVNLRDRYMNFNVMNGDHTDAGEAVSPLVIGIPGSCFDRGPEGLDQLLAFGGGCSGVNDFDVLEPEGNSQAAMVYIGDDSHVAVLTQFTPNSAGDFARCVLSGFSFHTIRDIGAGTGQAAARHLQAILNWMEYGLGDPTAASGAAPLRDMLLQNYPNPFNPVTTIRYSIRERGRVYLAIYRITGELVVVLVDEHQTPLQGGYAVQWDGHNATGESVATGIYLYVLTCGNFSQTKKMLLLK